jgi:hypothetical protein
MKRFLALLNFKRISADAAAGASDEYGQIEETLAPAALLVMTDWIRKEVQ